MRKFFIVLAGVAAFFLGGCQKNTESDDFLSNTGDDFVGRLHFIGTDRISGDSNNAEINSFGNLPATAEFRNKMADKLAAAPFRIVANHVANHNTNNYSTLLRPLVEDLFRSESYAEMRGPTNAVPELMLAIRLKDDRANIWLSDLACVITNWTGIAITSIQGENFKGWELKKHHDPNVIRCMRSGEWVLFGWGWNDLVLQSKFIQRIRENKLTAECSKTALLDVVMNWPVLLASHKIELPFPLPDKLPKMHLEVEQRKDFLRSSMTMKFPQPLGLKLEAWKIPTNSIPIPFSSFNLGRGINAWLGDTSVFKRLSAPSIPNQFVMWSAAGSPFDTAFALPVSNATNYFRAIAPKLVDEINEFLHNYPRLKTSVEKDEIVSQGSPLFNLHIQPRREAAGDFLIGSLFPSGNFSAKNTFPKELLKEILSKPNLIYYGWEVNQDRAFQLQTLHQADLMMAGKNYPSLDGAMENWLLAIRPKLSTCGTEITLAKPDELSLVRNSKIGFSGIELVELEYWIDSPNFPFKPFYPAVPMPSHLGKPAKK